jgi:O-antigen/teichoic acid export membrane protein
VALLAVLAVVGYSVVASLDSVLLYLLILSCVYLVAGMVAQMYTTFFVAKRLFDQLAFWRIVSSVSPPILMALAAGLTGNVLAVAGSYFGVSALVAWLGWFSVVKRYALHRAYREGQVDRACLSYGLKFIPTSLVMMTRKNLAQFLVGSFSGFQDLAVFSVANSLGERFFGLVRIVDQLLYADFARDDSRSLVHKIRPKLGIALVAAFAISLPFAVAGFLYIQWFMPDEYGMAAVYFGIVALAFPAAILLRIPVLLVSTDLHFQKESTIYVAMSIIEIAVIALFGWWKGTTGIPIAIALSRWIALAIAFAVGLGVEGVVDSGAE